MKAYHHHQRGLTLFEVSIAISVALAVLLSFAPYYIKLMERGLVEQTAQRAKMVYEAAINYRLDGRDIDGDGHADHVWPRNTTELVNDGYLPDLARQTSWGNDITLDLDDEDLQMKFTLPEMRFVNAVAAKLPVPEIDRDNMKITQIIQRPGQEASLSQLQDLAGIRAWTGDHEAGGNDLTDVHTLKAKFIVTDETVELGESCSPPAGQEDRNKPGKGAWAIAEDSGVSVPVLCNGTQWVRQDKLDIMSCKVCIACSDGGSWSMVACDFPDDDGWAYNRTADVCADDGFVAVKFVCGSDRTAGQFPAGGDGHELGDLHQYYPSDLKGTGLVTTEEYERASSDQPDESNDISFE